MVKCIDCAACVPVKSEVNGRRFLGCQLKQLSVDKNIWDTSKDPEKWVLMERNPEVFDKMWEIQPLEEHECCRFRKRTIQCGEDWFDKSKGKSYDKWIRNWWFKHEVSNDAAKEA